MKRCKWNSFTNKCTKANFFSIQFSGGIVFTVYEKVYNVLANSVSQ